jgi:hypothetical protein
MRQASSTPTASSSSPPASAGTPASARPDRREPRVAGLADATLVPAATIAAAVAVLFFGPVALRVPYALLAGYTAAGALTWFAVAFVFSTAIEDDVASYFANQQRVPGLFEFSRPFLHAAFVHDLRRRAGDVDGVWLLAAFAMAAGIVHALRAGLERAHEPEPGA